MGDQYYTGTKYEMTCVANAINRVLRGSGNNFPKVTPDGRLVRTPGRFRVSGTTYWLHVGDPGGAIDLAIASEIATPSGRLLNGRLVNEPTRLTLTRAATSVGSWVTTNPAVEVTPGARIPLVLYFGQSNAVGQRTTDAIANWPAGQQAAQSGTLGWWRTNTGSYNSTSLGWELVQPTWLQDDPAVFKGAPWLSMVAKLRETNPYVGVIAYGEGGTAMYTNWVAGGGNNTEMLHVIDSALACAPTPVYIAGAIFDQGESDANNATYAAAYETNLRALIAQLRTAYGSQIKFGIRRLWDDLIGNPSYTQAVVIRAAQAAVAAEAGNFLIDADDLLCPTDGVHFNSAGYIAIGERSATGLRTAGAFL